MGLTKKENSMTASTILLLFQRAYVLRIKKPAYIGSGMRVCLWEGYVHSEQMADIRLIAVRRRVSSVRTRSHVPCMYIPK
jgi:hypothetical protein